MCVLGLFKEEEIFGPPEKLGLATWCHALVSCQSSHAFRKQREGLRRIDISKFGKGELWLQKENLIENEANIFWALKRKEKRKQNMQIFQFCSLSLVDKNSFSFCIYLFITYLFIYLLARVCLKFLNIVVEESIVFVNCFSFFYH